MARSASRPGEPVANFGQQKKGKKSGGSANNLPALPGLAELSHGRCKVCKSPYRREIDMLLATGWSQANVLRHFNQLIEDAAEQFTPQNMSTHARNHLTSRDAAVRKIMEERARQMGVDVELAENFITTKAAALDTIIHQGLHSLHTGSTQAEPKEIIAAIQMLEKMESEWKETAIDELMSEFKIFMECVRESCIVWLGEEKGEDFYGDITDRFEARVTGRQSPVLKPIPADVARMKAERNTAEYIEDAEFEDVEDA